MRIDPRAWAAVLLAVLALWLAAPGEEEFIIPQRRRSPIEWLRHRLARAARDRQEERDATDFLAKVRDADPQPYLIRQRDLPSATRRIDTALLADGERPPWPAAPYAPDPEDEEAGSQEDPQEDPQEPAREEAHKPLPELRAWSPGDPGKTPTGVLKKITPEVERQLRPYLEGLPRYRDEPGQ
jgi:hypothetical protein